MTTFHLIRHAEKAADSEVLSGRAEGIGLSDSGRRRAAELAEAFRGPHVAAVLSSPLQRAMETAAPIAEAAGVSVESSAALVEMNFGDWTNQSTHTLSAHERWQQFNIFRSAARIPGGETMLEVQARVAGEMIRLGAVANLLPYILVSHAEPIRAAVAYFAGMPLDLWSRLEVRPGSVTTIALGPWGAKLVRLNHVLGDTF